MSKKLAPDLTEEDLEKYNRYHYLTVGRLIEYLQEALIKGDLKEDSIVFTQRIEDWYFDEGRWKTIKKNGDDYINTLTLNRKIENGEFDDKEQYPNIKEPMEYYTDEVELEKLKEEYIPVWSAVKYKDDNNLYLDIHY